GGLLAAVPLSAMASENILAGAVSQSEGSFSQSLSAAVQGGLQSDNADSLMWQYSQIKAIKPSAWWQTPVAEHQKLNELTQLSHELDALYQQQIRDGQDALQRQLHRWNAAIAEAQNAGISADGLDVETSRFVDYAAVSATPNGLTALASVLSEQYTILDGRMAAYRDMRAQIDAAQQNGQALLASASQYPQLSLDGFRAQIASAMDSIRAAHGADALGPILSQVQQTDARIQALLDSRTNAFNQLSATRSTLASAQSIGASVGNIPGTINSLAAQLNSAGDQGSFDALSGQLYQQKQLLASAIYYKQMQPLSYNAGSGKLIVISLSRQVLTAFQDGTAVLTTYVATGRPALPTPPGVYHVFARYAPYKMISPWPYGSPYWYPPSWTNFAMEFIGGGYFIHDAPWRSWYGPGSNIYNGTHGCVNVPYSPMSFLWNWTPIGTTVVVQY
ncbi:MAG TPA: L,D-transpeptidase, partial [Candidatus Dormibacteraeota bacterium]|nr:L,D-transpeptidase [Candidatus Dormibacteraeota bacterium]